MQETLFNVIRQSENGLVLNILNYSITPQLVINIETLYQANIIMYNEYNYSWYRCWKDLLINDELICEYINTINYNVLCKIIITAALHNVGSKYNLDNIKLINPAISSSINHAEFTIGDNFVYPECCCCDDDDENRLKIINDYKTVANAIVYYSNYSLDFNETLKYLAQYKADIFDKKEYCVDILTWLIAMGEFTSVRIIIQNISSINSPEAVCEFAIDYPNMPILFELILNKLQITQTVYNGYDWDGICGACYNVGNIEYLKILNKVMQEQNIPKLIRNGNFYTSANITPELVDAVNQLHDNSNERDNNYGRFCLMLDYYEGFCKYVDTIDSDITNTGELNYLLLVECVILQYKKYINYFLEHFINKGLYLTCFGFLDYNGTLEN